jgi:hypothetical protein
MTFRPALVDPQGWSHNWQAGWSHATGKTSRQLVPCGWQVTAMNPFCSFSVICRPNFERHRPRWAGRPTAERKPDRLCFSASPSPGRGDSGPVAHDCFEAGGRRHPRSCSERTGVDA